MPDLEVPDFIVKYKSREVMPPGFFNDAFDDNVFLALDNQNRYPAYKIID
jgi:hypothetical protein